MKCTHAEQVPPLMLPKQSTDSKRHTPHTTHTHTNIRLQIPGIVNIHLYVFYSIFGQCKKTRVGTLSKISESNGYI